MKQDAGEPWHLDKRVPISLIVALLLQTCSFVWWGAKIDEKVSNHAAKITMIEENARSVSDHQNGVAERLARMEERTSAMTESLSRIEGVLRDMAGQGRRR